MPLTYDFTLGLASIMVAVLASFTALHLASRISVARGKGASLAWLGGGALSMGVGIWSMHFVGMLGSSIGIPMVYGPWWTLVSLMIAVTVSGFALFLVRKEGLSRISLVIGSVIMGGGIASMHYTGMMALQISPVIRFEPFLVAMSVLIAVLASFTALSLFVALRSSTVKHPFIKRAASALVMGFAIAGMHYTAMAAAQFSPGSICTAPTGNMSNVWLGSTIAVFTLLILAISLITAIYDAHLMGRDLLNDRLRLESLQLDRANRQISQQSENLQILNLELEDKVFKRTEQLEEADRRKDEFLAILAHELRNPLAAVANAAQLLLKLQTSQEPLQMKAHGIIERQVGQLKRLVDDLLDISRISTGTIRLCQEQVYLNDMVEKSVETVQPLILKRRHALAVSLPQTPLRLQADAVRIEQVLVNLLTNAAKYTDEGGCIWLSVEGADAVPPMAVIRVRDNGIGIAPTLLPNVFDMFSQAERSSERSQGGMGIGLALVRQLVELHGGSVNVDSVLGRGSEFVVRLPVVADALCVRTLAAEITTAVIDLPVFLPIKSLHTMPLLPVAASLIGVGV